MPINISVDEDAEKQKLLYTLLVGISALSTALEQPLVLFSEVEETYTP